MSQNIVNPRAAVQIINLQPDALKFQCPFAMSISGPSQEILLMTMLLYLYNLS